MNNQKLKAKKEQWAIITGASSGIGRQFALSLAELGYNLFITGRRKDALEETKKMCANVNVEIRIGDLAKRGTISQLVDELKEFQDIGFLINNAGFGGENNFFEMSNENITGMIDVHITATVELCKALIPKMSDNAYIINVSSIAGMLKTPQNGMYSGTKAFLNAFSLGIDKDLRELGKSMSVQALCPGFTYSDFHDRDIIRKKFDRKSIPTYFWMTSKDVVDYSLRKIRSKKVIVVPGILNKLLVWVFSNSFFVKYVFGSLRRMFKKTNG